MSPPETPAPAPEPRARVVVRRRYRVLGMLVLASVAWWVGVWMWTRADLVRMQGLGEGEVVLALHELDLVTRATWAWVFGALLVHLGVLAVTLRTGDREARIGAAQSLLFHVLFSLSWGVVGP